MSQDGNGSSYDPLFGGGKSATFNNIGDSYTGTVISSPREMQQRDLESGEPKFYKDGNPMMQTVIEIQTAQRDPEDDADDGVRVLYMKGQRIAALRNAIRTAGIKSRQDMVGATVTVTCVKQEKPERKGLNGKKVYDVSVKRGTTSSQSVSDDPFAG
jgi:hypothetical protein